MMTCEIFTAVDELPNILQETVLSFHSLRVDCELDILHAVPVIKFTR